MPSTSKYAHGPSRIQREFPRSLHKIKWSPRLLDEHDHEKAFWEFMEYIGPHVPLSFWDKISKISDSPVFCLKIAGWPHFSDVVSRDGGGGGCMY